jgi:YbbR domain-containing protein
VRRVADFLIRNWPLKLGAIVLATVLYSGLVLGQNVRTWTGTLPVEALHQPAGATLLSDLDPVTQVRYRAPLDVGVVSPASFHATVDLALAQGEPGGQSQTLPVTVFALDSRIQIVDYQPQNLQIQLDPVREKDMLVTVTIGTVPDGVSVAPPQTDPSSVTIRGASSRVDIVTSVVARVAIDASALNVDREVELIAVDSNGNQVPNIEIDPERARVRIAVARELANKSLPVVPQITGVPGSGYRITSLTVDPLVVTVSGEQSTLTQLETAPTEPIDVSGRTHDLEAMVRFALPPGVSVTGGDTVRVVVTIAEETGTRTFHAGLNVVGNRPDLNYSLSISEVNVTVGGPITALDAVNATTLVASVDVSALAVGDQQATIDFTAPTGLEIVSISPAQVTVTVTAATAPSASPAP